MESQLKLVIRPMYSSPPTYGAAIVSTILHLILHLLHSPALYDDWKVELTAMADRIISMRHQLAVRCVESQENTRRLDSQSQPDWHVHVYQNEQAASGVHDQADAIHSTAIKFSS